MGAIQPTHHDAELILKLYDLRREPVMREARKFIAGFSPKSVDDLLAVANTPGTQNAYLRQVYGYWEMAAAFVVHGALPRSSSTITEKSRLPAPSPASMA